MKRDLEKTVEDTCVDLAANEGFRAAKLDRLKRSDPDRLFYHPIGVCFLVEFKRKGTGPRKQQAARIRKLDTAGFSVSVIDTEQDFTKLLRRQVRLVNRVRKYLQHVAETGRL